MEITLLRGCVVDAEAHTRGDCFETDDVQARYLLKTGAAVEGKDDTIKPLPGRVAAQAAAAKKAKA